MARAGKYELDMTHGPMATNILRFALPLMLSGAISLSFNAADVMVIGKFVGDYSQAAVTSSSSVIGLLTNLFMGLSAGVNVVVARALGEGKKASVSAAVHTGMAFGVLVGVLLAVLGVAATPMLLDLVGCPSDLLDLAALYMRCVFLGMPASALYQFGSALLRAGGDTKRPMYFVTLSGVVNVVLNLIFVLWFHWDVAGVAIATALSNGLSAYLVIRCLMQEEGSLHFEPMQLRIDFAAAKEVVRIGIPAGIQTSLFSIANVVVQTSVNSLGPIAMAGSGAATNIGGFGTVAASAFYQSAMTFSAQNRGAGKLERIDKALGLNLLFTAVGTTVLMLGICWAGPWLLGIYTDDPEVIAVGMLRLVWCYGSYALYAMILTFMATLRALGYSLYPTIVALVGNCGLRVVWIVTVFEKVHTPTVLFMGFPATWTVTVTVLAISFLVLRPKTYAKILAQAAQQE